MQMFDPSTNMNLIFDEETKKYKVRKYHVTLMKKRGWQKSAMDVTTVLKALGKFIFGTLSYNKITLNRLDENHSEVCKINLA